MLRIQPVALLHLSKPALQLHHNLKTTTVNALLVATTERKHMSDLSSPTNNDSQSLKYLDLFTIIKEKIDNYEWPENETIPTERELAERYQTSRTTVRKAIEHLRQKGICIANTDGEPLFFLNLAVAPSVNYMDLLTISLPETARRSSRSLNLALSLSMNLFVTLCNSPATAGFYGSRECALTIRPQWVFKLPIFLSMKKCLYRGRITGVRFLV